MGKQLKHNGHPVFELNGDLFTLAFPKDSWLSAYLQQRFRYLPEPLDLHLWRWIKSNKTWQYYSKLSPFLSKYKNGLEFLKDSPEYDDLVSIITDPFLVQRVVQKGQDTGCFLVSSEDISPASDSKGNYGSRQKLIEAKTRTSAPVVNEKGKKAWGFRPMLIPLDKKTMEPDTVLFEKNNPNGVTITGGLFTLDGKDVRQCKDPVTMNGLSTLLFEETEDTNNSIQWVAWGGCLMATDTLWRMVPDVALEYVGRP